MFKSRIKYKRIRENPWKDIINVEWYRAQKLMKPLLDGPKPKFFWATYHGDRTATCFKRSRQIYITRKYIEQQDVVPMQDFIDTVRHEIIHLIVGGGHPKRFYDVVKLLDGGDYRGWDFMRKELTSYGKERMKAKGLIN